MPARDLLGRLFGGAPADLERALPFWGDGGRAGRHVVAAWPDRVIRIARTTDQAELARALRELVPPPSAARAPLVVVGLAYDAGRALEPIGPGPHDDLGLPEVVIARYPGYLEGASADGPFTPVGDCRALLAGLESAGRGERAPETRVPPLELVDPAGRERYRSGIVRVLEHIAAGDLYQANIARRLEAPCPAGALPALYRALRGAQPNPYGALWALGADAWIASNSPECLLHWQAGTRTAKSFPIKGTRPRGATPTADRDELAALERSAKDQAEHVMIVDLVRNDLGRVARTGTVRVEALFEAMTLATVHHLVSTVACEVEKDKDLVDVVLALFPGGSITGAPKIAAMQLIDRVEPFRRSFYCGSIGLVFGGDEAVFSILIRTLLAARGRVVYATGGGIVADSDPEAEWAETQTKARALMLALDQQGTP